MHDMVGTYHRTRLVTVTVGGCRGGRGRLESVMAEATHRCTPHHMQTKQYTSMHNDALLWGFTFNLRLALVPLIQRGDISRPLSAMLQLTPLLPPSYLISCPPDVSARLKLVTAIREG